MDAWTKGTIGFVVVICIALSALAIVRQREAGQALDRVASRLGDLETETSALRETAAEMDRSYRRIQSEMSTVKWETQSERDSTRQALDGIDARLTEGLERLDRTEADRRMQAAMDELRRDQAALQQLWTRAGELLPAIPDELLAEGYVVEWEGGPALPLEPVNGIVGMLPEGRGLKLLDGAYLMTMGPATPLSKALAESGEVSVEVVLRPADLRQAGPARIVSLSRDSGYRNFTVGQEGTGVSVRFRTTGTDPNGTNPVLSVGGVLTGGRQHLLFVRRGEENILYVDGEPAGTEPVPGDMSNWDHSLPLMVGNEATGDRTWQGEVYRVVFFNRALEPDEVRQRAADAAGG